MRQIPKRTAARPANGPVPKAPRRLIVPVRLYQQIADALRERMAAGEFKGGDRLPTERELAAYYTVSRTCVREALLALELSRLVSIRVGSGVYVLGHDVPVTTASDARSLTELLDARLMFEPEICAAAAANARPEHIVQIRDNIALMREELRTKTKNERGDRDFHHSIAQASGNSIAQDLVRDIWKVMSAELWQGLQRHIQNPDLRLKWIEDHELIFDAIENRDRRRARITMRRHIENVIESLNRANFS